MKILTVKHWSQFGDPLEKLEEGMKDLNDGIPRERQTFSTKLYTYELPGNNVPSREHTQAVLRTLVHM